MSWVFLGGFVLLGALALYQYLGKMDRRRLMRGLRWLVGGGLALVAVLLLLVRRFDIALFAAAGAAQVFRMGRLGPFSFDAAAADKGNVSAVRSYYFSMELDHDTGAVTGNVVAGQYAGADLMDLGEVETRLLLAEVEGDADSMSLLESWLDANRSGWREYFAAQDAGEAPPAAPAGDPLAEAYAVLGLKPGASDEDIRSAHRELMKGVHPDHGGSSYLASKINAARDLLLKQ
ncbi:hypothetical protein ASD04_01155 [Devosia sp. Root436]|jgi:hypothetical protein|uniref:DnaJ domain-containing protein n=1 Tax=Devosia sp. Root436 TaxID=1736537 RepID=UPI0007005310|nr:DnaJ domain-containing protein [Devosia sp. Root436]KQX42606.1 hypothetical protein ASD04_01155 [Devosia sp. Root436]